MIRNGHSGHVGEHVRGAEIIEKGGVDGSKVQNFRRHWVANLIPRRGMELGPHMSRTQHILDAGLMT